MNLILPQSTLGLLERVPVTSRHPGLQLDKLSIPGDQSVQKKALEKTLEANDALTKPNDEFQQLRQRWLLNVQASGTAATLLRFTTTGPLTLHLARASALENAGICLHPLYGFVYLPGSGLKGMARAFAETVWLPTQSDMKAAWRKIEDVFGWAPNPERKQQIRDPNHPAEKRFAVQGDPKSPEVKAHVGDVIFHEAWPETWPKLIVDIVNNHHPDYYQHADNQHAPGDWENPVPVYFLAAAPGVAFTFPLAKRRSDVPDDLLRLASEWLLGALCHLGTGAKTNAGYGAFAPADDSQAEIVAAVASTWDKAIKSPKHRAEFSTTLELVTPAFLAGANQQAEDCDLRPATLRGHLRWWWRTMHAGFLDVQTLRALEAAIWGDTKSGGAVRIVVEKGEAGQTLPFPAKFMTKNSKNQDVLRLDPTFAKNNQLHNAPQKRTQGVLYLSFGMDEMPAGRPLERKQRWCMLPGAKWNVTLKVRDSSFKQDHHPHRIPADQVLAHAKAALSLLCQFGGVGSKGRNGFGSLGQNDLNVSNCFDEILATAVRLRGFLSPPNESHAAVSPSLHRLCGPLMIVTPWKNYWFVLDQLGFSIQDFCQSAGQKRSWVKEALGLPRKIGASDSDGSGDRRYSRSFDRQTNQEVVWLGQNHPHLNGREPKDMRHASPVHIHVNRNSNDTFSISIIAFPCSVLPDGQESEQELKSLIQHLKSDLEGRAKSHANTTGASAASSSKGLAPTIHPQQPAALSRPQPGQRVEAKLLAEKTKKGGWKAKHEQSGLSGPIQNTGDVPGDKIAGDTLTLIVASANEREIAFRYPTAADEQRSKKGKGGK
jgi:CRISPR-associated protein Cmr6